MPVVISVLAFRTSFAARLRGGFFYLFMNVTSFLYKIVFYSVNVFSDYLVHSFSRVANQIGLDGIVHQFLLQFSQITTVISLFPIRFAVFLQV